MGTTADCWLWTGSTDRHGYGQVRVGGRPPRGRLSYTHRLAYEAFFGPIPDGLELDHLCRTPACFNPFHLEPVTHRENMLRGVGIAAVNARKTQCPHGHPYDTANTRITADGSRSCRACKAAYDKRRRLAA